MLCGNLDGRGVWGRMDTCVCMAEFLHCSPKAITPLFVNWLYPNTKFKVFKKKTLWEIKGGRAYSLLMRCTSSDFQIEF